MCSGKFEPIILSISSDLKTITMHGSYFMKGWAVSGEFQLWLNLQLVRGFKRKLAKVQKLFQFLLQDHQGRNSNNFCFSPFKQDPKGWWGNPNYLCFVFHPIHMIVWARAGGAIPTSFLSLSRSRENLEIVVTSLSFPIATMAPKCLLPPCSR